MLICWKENAAYLLHDVLLVDLKEMYKFYMTVLQIFRNSQQQKLK